MTKVNALMIRRLFCWKITN